MSTTFKEWCDVMFIVPPDTARRFVRTVLKIRPEDNSLLELLTQLQIGVFDWVSHLGLPEGWPWDIVTAIEPALKIFAEDLADALDEAAQPAMFQVVLADGRYLGCTMQEKWYDMDKAEDVDELPGPAVTLIRCDVTALYYRLQQRVEVLRRKRKEASNVAPAGPAGQDGQSDAQPLRDWEPES